jgi:hypothetical protein
MIYMPSFIKIGSGMQNLIEGDSQTQHGDIKSFFSLIKRVWLKCCSFRWLLKLGTFFIFSTLRVHINEVVSRNVTLHRSATEPLQPPKSLVCVRGFQTVTYYILWSVHVSYLETGWAWDIALGKGAEGTEFNSRHIQQTFPYSVHTGCSVNPASYPMGTGALSLGAERPRPEANRSSPFSADVKNNRAIIPKTKLRGLSPRANCKEKSLVCARNWTPDSEVQVRFPALPNFLIK